jgi:hypothetical protein
MLASSRLKPHERRGIVLVLILGMLALLAIIGVTFATFSGQTRVGARSFAQSMQRPPQSDLMDFALSQLIGDTGDIRSAIRGHSMARDMYGNDAANNGYLASRPGGAGGGVYNYNFFYAVNYHQVGTSNVYDILTNIRLDDPAFYGYNFTRWVLRITYTGAAPHIDLGVYGKPVDQTFEVVFDNNDPQNHLGSALADGVHRVLRVNPADGATVLHNPTLAARLGLASGTPWTSIPAPPQNLAVLPFVLDGRYLRAFNGPGMGVFALNANFRYNGRALGQSTIYNTPGDPNLTGMDEDYDACDLENWFLAIQSADGQVVVPSFHRPGILRYDANSGTSDWSRLGLLNAPAQYSQTRILRPRGADNDPQFAANFPDPVPNATTQQITYDVDNDGDGTTDSVWLDLGYPARTDERGQLYKPLFAFLVLGLNGRIPLNTAGNIAGANHSSASHLGNSPSELDPTYALQNTYTYSPNPLLSSQLDNATIDVRLTQLRNLLTGTRPASNLTNPDFNANGDANLVRINGLPYYMPNGQYDATVTDGVPDQLNGPDPVTGTPNSAVARNTQPVPGRWGEADLVQSIITLTAGPYGPAWANRVRAGLSRGYTYGPTGFPRDADDDNYNAFDPYPPPQGSLPGGHAGEVEDQDWFDSSGGLILPVERIRRFVTPMDINGTGHVVTYTPTVPTPPFKRGGDAYGRVTFLSYFRPPGLPGIIDIHPADATYGAIGWLGVPALQRKAGDPAVDRTNNPTHGFDSFRFPTATPAQLGGMPFDLNAGTAIPTYDTSVNGRLHTDGLDDADEMNLYQTNGLDAPYGPGDLEWLYRVQDVDGAQLSSRLSSLAPISFTPKTPAPGDTLRRRRLFSIDSWERNNFVWTNDNPAMLDNTASVSGLWKTPFGDNSRFSTAPTFFTGANTDFANLKVLAGDMGNPNFITYPWSQFLGPYLQVPTNTAVTLTPDPVVHYPASTPGVASPSISHREKKINLNFPFPVSNDPDEAVRQKWISESYQLLKAVLPPHAIDTPEELAQLSQFLVNVVDFRDPDGAMTHFKNPDVTISFPPPGLIPTLSLTIGTGNLDQYGMEYNPIALNEVLAYTFLRNDPTAGNTQTPRFFVELLNTLTASSTPNTTPPPAGQWPFNTSSTLDLGGFSYTPMDPHGGGAWDLVFTDDGAASRPDPYTGQILNPGGLYYGLIPLNKDAFGPASNPTASNVSVVPLAPAGPPPVPNPNPIPPNLLKTNYYYVIANPDPPAGFELSSPSSSTTPPTLIQKLDTTFDPVGGTNPSNFQFRPGVLPGITAQGTTPPPSFKWKIPTPPVTTGGAAQVKFYWMCLRRPANPFDKVSAINPMVVVDAVRFPYIDGTGKITAGNPPSVDTTRSNDIWSIRRWQPYRGGQAIPPGTGTAKLDPHYGFTEQIVPPVTGGVSATQGVYDPPSKQNATNKIYHGLGTAATATEAWDYFPSHDRDFTSVAELMLVPGCPPGLFTKQFVENAPSSTFTTPTPLPQLPTGLPLKVTAGTIPTSPALLAAPHVYPYLVDKFFYTGASDSAVPAHTVDGYTSGGWFKMFEFFEVPSQADGSIGPIAQGANFDWARQDLRPGLLNLNLIIDEEVFLGLLGQDDSSFNQQLLNFTTKGPSLSSNLLFNQPHVVPLLPNQLPRVVTSINAGHAPLTSYEIGHQGHVYLPNDNLYPPPNNNIAPLVKAAFAQFLKVRHGGSGFLFGYGWGLTGTPNNVVTPNQLIIAAERPFRSLSFPDINLTVMRPAALPPSIYSNPVLDTTWPPVSPATYTNDPGLKNNNLFPGYPTGTLPTSLLPPAIPARRLFQNPDFFAGPSPHASNASEAGDPYINTQVASPPSLTPPATGITTGSLGGTTNNTVNLVSPVPIPPATTGNPYLGSGGATDGGQHPYYRSEMLQRVMNLTTVRTHQYAVWITVGFFRVTRQGDPSLAYTNPGLAYDQLGQEVGLPGGKKTRYRAFFIVDRTKLTGFDPYNPGSYRDAVIYRQNIQ